MTAKLQTTLRPDQFYIMYLSDINDTDNFLFIEKDKSNILDELIVLAHSFLYYSIKNCVYVALYNLYLKKRYNLSGS